MRAEPRIGNRAPRSGVESRSIRVAMVFATDFKKASAGGIMTLLGELITRLSNQFQILVVGVGDRGTDQAVGQRFRVPSLRMLPILSPERKPGWLPLNVAFTAALFGRRRQIQELADVIHVHRMETALPFVMRKAKPVLLTVHGCSKFHAMTQTGPLRWRAVKFLYDVVEGIVFSRADRVILVSREAYDYYRSRHPRLRHKFVVIPNFIETSELQRVERTSARSAYLLTANDTAVVYAGRLVQEKRVDALLEAFALLVRERPSAHLFIAGEGPDGARLRQQADRLQVNNVHFLGLLEKSEIHRLLAGADLLALPSRFEGFPMIVLEALAYGVPVVASDVGGIREMFGDGLEPFIWCTSDPDDLKRKMLDAADRGTEVHALCIGRASRFDTARILPQLEELYAGLRSTSATG